MNVQLNSTTVISMPNVQTLLDLSGVHVGVDIPGMAYLVQVINYFIVKFV